MTKGRGQRNGGPVAPRQGTSKADLRRQDIIYRAAQLFDRVGYHQTSVDDIAEAAGIRKPTLYHYFSGKEEILYWVHEEYGALLIERLEERAASDLSARDNLRLLALDLIGRTETHRAHVRISFEYERELPPKYRQLVKEERRRYQHMVEDILRRGVRLGEFRQLDPRLTAMALLGMCNWTYHWYRRGGALDAEELAEVFTGLLVDGIAADRAAAVEDPNLHVYGTAAAEA